jgi:tetratricopeptide (TPR) repeat protein
LRPTPQQRAEALRAHLRRVVSRTALFQVGLWFYYAGDYPQAIRAFEDFRSFFPGREVHHNLAASHHQLALQAYQAWKQELPVLPFQLSLAVDSMTRASRIYLEGPKRGGAAAAADPAAMFRHHLDEAIAFYRETLAHDPSYTPAAINLGCALIVRGLHAEARGLNADFSEAVTTLLRAFERDPNSPELLNNLGVALWYVERRDQAKDQLARARTLAPAYAAPVFNLGQLAHIEQREADARDYWRAYEQLAPRPSPGASAAKPGTESVMGLTVGQLEDRVPQPWGTPARSTFQVEKRTLAMATYPAGVLTLAQDGEIRMVMVREGFRGASAGGVTIGSEARDVVARYGSPSRRLELMQGQSWAYDAQRIAFQVRDGRVVSWLLF